MVFSSLLFLFRFLPIVLLIYYLSPKKVRNLVLFLASLMFYAWGEPVYVCLLLFSTVLDYTMGRMIGYFRRKEQKKGMKICLLTSLVVNLGLLGVFKYADFFVSTFNSVTQKDVGLLHLALPIGISFYTFQTLSYTIDVYLDKVSPQKNIISFGAYVALFPQLIAGPIVRYKTIEKELNHRTENLDDFSEGVVLFSAGLAKKVLIANTVGALFSEISALSNAQLSVGTAWFGVLAFTLQIYFDFSGYSDMAIGLGKMFGFHFLKNFDHPYESKSITEFWRHWHISLSSWFKEYVYIPLGGNRHGKPKQFLYISIVWLLTGLWHGASWNFVLWGVYYGVLLMIEKLFWLKWLQRIPAFFQHVYTMACVVVGWAFFCYPDLTDKTGYVKALLGHAGKGLVDKNGAYLLMTNAIILIIAVIGATSLPFKVGKWIAGKKEMLWNGIVKMAFVAACLFLSITYLISDTFNPFLYFRF